MDGLALLCNLHSEGPLALRRLRMAGVRDLADLEEVPLTTLIECLRCSPGPARRFQIEARLLAGRLSESPLDPEPLARPATEVGALASHFGGRPSGEPPEPAPEPRPGLRPEHLDGLDARLCEALAAQGIHSLDAFQERAGLGLARAIGVPLTRLLDLATRARLALRARPARSGAARDASGDTTPQRVVVPESSRRTAAPVTRPAALAHTTPTAAPFPGPFAEPGSAGPFV